MFYYDYLHEITEMLPKTYKFLSTIRKLITNVSKRAQ